MLSCTLKHTHIHTVIPIQIFTLINKQWVPFPSTARTTVFYNRYLALDNWKLFCILYDDDDDDGGYNSVVEDEVDGEANGDNSCGCSCDDEILATTMPTLIIINFSDIQRRVFVHLRSSQKSSPFSFYFIFFLYTNFKKVSSFSPMHYATFPVSSGIGCCDTTFEVNFRLP